MKEDVLNLIATYGALAEAVTWAWIAAAVFIACFTTWGVVAIVRCTASAIHRANQVTRAAELDLISAEDLDAHLTACWRKFADEARKETQ